MSQMQDLLISHGRADMVMHALPKGEVLALAHAPGRLSVTAGGVWLTRSGDFSDHFLRAGESVDLDGSGRTLVESWGGAAAAIEWRAEAFADRIRETSARVRERSCRLVETCDRGWQQVDARRRAALGVVGAVAALAITAATFIPYAEHRTRALAEQPARAADAHNGGDGRFVGSRDAVGNDGPRGAAREAGRRAPGAA